MSKLLETIKIIGTKYPLYRGMLTYSLIWPTSALIQQFITGETWGTIIFFYPEHIFYVLLTYIFQYYFTKSHL